ncbi:MAG: glycosyltransferase, partial [Candidatus Dojkabacteria bacterium]
LAALKDLKQDFPYLRYLVLGRRKGGYFRVIKRLVERLGLHDIVEFTGFVSAEERDRLIKQSWLTVSTSVKEGWGLAVAEAAALATPAVVYDVPGNRDAVKHLETGLHTIDNTPEMLAQAIRKLLTDEKLRSGMGENARKFASTLDWERSYEQFKEVVGLS